MIDPADGPQWVHAIEALIGPCAGGAIYLAGLYDESYGLVDEGDTATIGLWTVQLIDAPGFDGRVLSHEAGTWEPTLASDDLERIATIGLQLRYWHGIDQRYMQILGTVHHWPGLPSSVREDLTAVMRLQAELHDQLGLFDLWLWALLHQRAREG